jgi:hypothetical protein
VPLPPISRRPSLALAVLSCALATAACGSSGSKSAATSGDTQVVLSRCMRAHGVPNYPDPVSPVGGGIERRGAPGLSRDSPAVRQAATVCNHARSSS